MSEFYASAGLTAAKLIEKFGKPFTFVRRSDSRDPVTGVTTTGVVTEYRPKGVFKQIKKTLVDGVLVQSGDRMIITDNSFSPTMSDKVIVAGTEWSIVNIDELAPAEFPVVYYVRVRR